MIIDSKDIKLQFINQDSFISRMAQIKINWKDLDNWTQQQLHQLVAQFIENGIKTIPLEQIQVILQGDQIPQQTQVIYPNKMSDDPINIEVKSANLKYHFKQKSKVQVLGHFVQQQVSFFFFKRTQIYYRLRINQKSEIRRKQVDIIWLRSKLFRLCPWAYIPLLELKIQQKKQSQLQHFFDELISQPTVLNNEIIASFFEDNQQTFIARKPQFDNKFMIKRVSFKASPQSKQLIRIGNHYSNYYKCQKKLKLNQNILYNQLQIASDELNNALNQVSCKIDKIKQVFNKLQVSQLQMQCSVGVGRIKSFQKAFQNTQTFLQKWSSINKIKANTYKQSLSKFIQQRKKDFITINQTIQRKQQAQLEYLKKRKQKQRLEQAGENVRQLLQNVTELKLWYGMMNVSCQQSITNRQQRAARQYKEMMQLFSKKHIQLLKKQQQIFNNVIWIK